MIAEPGTPTLDQLKVFLTVIEVGSFAGAARRLNRATSVISYSIANLEAQLGVSLFDRESTRKPQLTEAGRALVDAAERDTRAFEAELDTADIPDPDLIIRTSGEQRLSNFLLWQAAYAEFVFLPIHWPDFDKSVFEFALDEYSARERRYGGASAPPAPIKSAS